MSDMGFLEALRLAPRGLAGDFAGEHAIWSDQLHDAADELDRLREENERLAAERRTLNIAIANATRAFADNDMASLATINETIQALVDAAIVWGRERAERLQAEVGAVSDYSPREMRLMSERDKALRRSEKAEAQRDRLAEALKDQVGTEDTLRCTTIRLLRIAHDALKNLDQPPILPVRVNKGSGGE